MEEGLFRSELEAVFDRYGYLIYHRCESATSSPNETEQRFQAVLLSVARRGAELRGRDDKLGWLYRVTDEVSRLHGAPNELELDKLHVGDPSTQRRAGLESDPDAHLRFAALDEAKLRFSREIDLRSALDRAFPDEPLVVLRARRGFGILVASCVLLVGGAFVFWPKPASNGIVPSALGLTVIVDRDGQSRREVGPEVSIQGGDRLQVEVAVPTQQTMSVLLIEKDGSLTPLAIGRLFRPGVHLLPQTLFIDRRSPLVARLYAGPPALVRTATSSGPLEGVLTIGLAP